MVSGLTKSYGKARGIDGLTLRVGEGEFFGFIGPNGAGKSTTIRTLIGLIKADAGKVEIFGKDIQTENRKILEETGYLPSEYESGGSNRAFGKTAREGLQRGSGRTLRALGA